MRVTSAFNRLLALPGACVTKVALGDRDVTLTVRLRAQLLTCPCGYRTRACYDRRERRWRHLDLGQCKSWLVYEIRRLDCPTCGVRTESVPWARPGARFSRDFEDTVAWLAQRTDKTTVASLLRISWEAVRGIIGRVVADYLDEARLDQLARLGVDEICYRHPRRYLTVIGDHDTGRVVHVAQGRDAAGLEDFLDQLGEVRRANITAVSMDMTPIYSRGAQRAVPHARVCYDPFHVIQWANQALDAVFAAASGMRQRTALSTADYKRARFALRAGEERLDPHRRKLLNALRRSDRQVGAAHRLKEQLRKLYREIDPDNARRYLNRWIGAASRSRIQPFVLLARRIKNNFDGIIAAIELGISNGLLESINAKIRLINARGYGHHSPEALTNMIYLCLGGIRVALPTQR